MHHLARGNGSFGFLSVRTPVQRRKILDSPNGRTKETALMVRFPPGLTGLTMVCSERPTIPALMVIPLPPQTTPTVPPGFVRDELSFQNELCNFVPNGGEVTLDNPLNDPRTCHSGFIAHACLLSEFGTRSRGSG